MKGKDPSAKEWGRPCSTVGRAEAVKCWASLGNRQQLEPGLWGGGGAERKERNKVRSGLWPTGQNEKDLGVPLRNLDFIRQCVGVIEGFRAKQVGSMLRSMAKKITL